MRQTCIAGKAAQANRRFQHKVKTLIANSSQTQQGTRFAHAAIRLIQTDTANQNRAPSRCKTFSAHIQFCAAARVVSKSDLFYSQTQTRLQSKPAHHQRTLYEGINALTPQRVHHMAKQAFEVNIVYKDMLMQAEALISQCAPNRDTAVESTPTRAKTVLNTSDYTNNRRTY